jgi:quercetin dioxygenase-like cupin family protein
MPRPTAPSAAYAPPATARRAVIVSPTGGTELRAFDDTLVVKLAGAETGDALTLALGTTPSGGGPPPHRHANEDELFIVVSGRLEYWLDGAWVAADPGTVVFMPRGVEHTFRNAGDTPARQWVITTPGGFDRFFAECADAFADAATAGVAPDMARVLATFAKHGLTLTG